MLSSENVGRHKVYLMGYSMRLELPRVCMYVYFHLCVCVCVCVCVHVLFTFGLNLSIKFFSFL